MRSVLFHPNASRVLLGLAYRQCTGRLPLFAGGPVSLESIRPDKLPGASWVRVRVRLAGICGSDLNLLRLKFSTRSASFAAKRSVRGSVPLGHEAVGEVIEVGKDVRSLTVGQRVVLAPGASCASVDRSPVCLMCARGLPLLCLFREMCNPPGPAGAGWSEELVRPESRLLPLPEDVPDEQGVLIEPLACSVHAVLRRPPVGGDTAIVIGCGVIGLGIILALRALAIPLKIVAIARHPAQVSRAQAAGADVVLGASDGELYDRLAAELATEVVGRGQRNRLLRCGAAVVYDAVGSSETLGHALRWARPRGAVVVEGITSRPAPFDCTAVWFREVDLIGSHGHGIETFDGRSVHTFALVIEWMQQRRLPTAGWITHRLPLSEYRRALQAADGKARSQAAKVVLEMNAA